MSLSAWSVRRRALVGLAGVVLVALVVGLVVVQRQRTREQRLDTAASAAAERFARAAEGRDLTAVAFAGAEATAVQEQYAAAVDGFGTTPPEVAVTGVRREGDEATADLTWTWPLGPDRWTYDTQLPLLAADDEDAPWEVGFAPSVVHPELAPDGLLDATRTRADRADVLGRDGTPLVTRTPVVEVGVQPSRATDPAALSRTLAGLLDVDAAALEERIAAAGPDAFVPVITLRRSDYEPLRTQLQPLAGTVFREDALPLAPTRAFARALLGTAGPVTAELVEQSGGRLAAGDVTGLSGLQRTYDERLSGAAGVLVEQVQGDARTELFSVAPVPGEPVQVTLDPAVQRAADAALATAAGSASLVAVDVATGDVVAVANTPLGGADRATTGQYPPGSTFKAVSTLALLGTGLTPEQAVGCPPTATVDGRSFRNFEGSALGQVPFRTAFAQSCNTAFVGLSDELEPSALPDTAATVGLGVPWEVGVDVFAGDVPAPESPVDLAASTIGQGRTLVSPAAMAQAAATIARGAWAPPRLVVEPDPGAPSTAPPPAADPAQLAVVRDLMRQVVLDGTASALGDVPGEPVHAKTGTAEYGTEQPPRTHAWTIGFQGPLAFAVLVEDGASGGAVAVPVVEAFLRGR